MKRSSIFVNRESEASAGGDRKRSKLSGPGDSEFPKLNQSDPDHARRIQQRRRMIAKGKNTVGYDEYLEKVPRDKRRFRCMKHPSTPDYTLDIPNKRWIGLVKAWRRSLHQYDPPDVLKAFDDKVDDATKPAAKEEVTLPMTVQAKQLSEAANKGLLVNVVTQQEASPTSITSVGGHDAFMSQEDDKELEEWDKAGGQEDDFLGDEVDSDDDLL